MMQAAPPPLHSGPITALRLVDRILEKSGAPGRPQTVDRIVAGDPTTAVTGIATTAMATFDCLKAAAAKGTNLIVTFDPPFWSGNDSLDRLEGDALFVAKRDFIRAHDLVIFNFHDHWRDRTPDGIATGMAKELGWERHLVSPADPALFRLPPTTLLGLAQQLHDKLADRTMRIVGDPKLPVSMVAGSWGNAAQLPTIRLFNSGVDVVVCGYTREWEAVEYAQDLIAAGGRKGLILLGQAESVAGGMRYCAEWLKTIIDEVPVTFIPVVEPYWNPDEPMFEINTRI
jgi:putative NIF3 family GTP cyclohydrolase 1 type 2